jgi:hypothetical protein
MGADAVPQLADIADEAGAGLDDSGGPQSRVDDPDEGRVLGARRGAGGWVKVRLAAEVQSNVLLGNEARADASAQMLVEEARDFSGGDVAAALEKALGEDGYRVRVGGDELGERVCELDLVVERGNRAALGGVAQVGQ